MATTIAAASRAFWAHLAVMVPPHVVRVRRDAGGTSVSGSIAPGAWVAPAIIGVLLYGFVVDLIATGFCFSCAAAGRTWWPYVVLVLLASWTRSFRVRIASDGAVTATRSLLGVPYARVRSASVSAARLPDGPGITRGVALAFEGTGQAPWLVGSQRAAAALLAAFARARA